MSFWISAVLIAGLVGAMIALTMGRARARAPSRSDYDIQVYRDQLMEVERDLTRGVISDSEAERVRLEVSRRLLDADRAGRDAAALDNRTGGYLMGGLIGLVMIGGAFGLYSRLGAPNYPDLPLELRLANADAIRANRPGQEQAEAQMGAVQVDPDADARMLELMVKLRAALLDRPNDLQGHLLLTRNEAVLGDYISAHKAQARVIAIKGEEASASDFSDLAGLMVLAAGGYVSPQAEDALAKALQRDPRNGNARYYSGLMFAQNGRPDKALRIWAPLLEESTPQAPWYEPIREQIEFIAADAGVRYSLPDAPAPRGPTSQDIQAASQMSAEEREDMIRGMVGQLSERLANEGGSPQEWARLIGAMGVLGETDRAAAIWLEAQGVFAEHPDMLATIRDAAKGAGVAQ